MANKNKNKYQLKQRSKVREVKAKMGKDKCHKTLRLKRAEVSEKQKHCKKSGFKEKPPFFSLFCFLLHVATQLNPSSRS